jgi:hypothetical protein
MAAPPFAVRIVSLDYYLAQPIPGLDVCYSSLEGTPVDRVPVVRVFGATPSGQKCCVHLHKVAARRRSPRRGRRRPRRPARPRRARCAAARRAAHTHGRNEPARRTPWPPRPQAFPYFYVPYDDDLPTDAAEGAAQAGG